MLFNPFGLTKFLKGGGGFLSTIASWAVLAVLYHFYYEAQPLMKDQCPVQDESMVRSLFVRLLKYVLSFVWPLSLLVR